MPYNRILASLSQEDYPHLFSKIESVRLEQGDVLFQPGERARHVYFPETCVLSVVVLAETGASIEAVMIGREGLGCLEAVLADGRTIHRTIVQVSGLAQRLDAALMREEILHPGLLQDRILGYTQSLLMHLSQASLCNRVHSVTERLCRWLLMAQDSIGSDHVEVTQEFVSQMLGVRRAGITEAAGALHDAGVIKWERGHVTIRDRKRLEAGACACYQIVTREQHRLLDERPSVGRRPLQAASGSGERS